MRRVKYDSTNTYLMLKPAVAAVSAASAASDEFRQETTTTQQAKS